MKKYIKRIILFLIVSHLTYVIALKWVNPPITITQFNSFLEGRGLKRQYIKYHEMGSNIKLCVIASEDQSFPFHNGFDFEEIEKSIAHNQKGKTLRGGSTISQQVAKNVFLWQSRTWIRKGLETYFTFMIELIWSKERILEVYLNISETGIGVFGVEAASIYYFNKHSKDLTPNEASRLAAVLPNPKRYNVNPPEKLIIKKSKWIEKQVRNIKSNKNIKELLSIEK